MSEGVNVDWGQLRQPDPLGDYVGAFQAGRRLAAPADRQPVAATQIINPAGGATDIQDRIDQMTVPQRQAASMAQEQFAAILNGLKMQTPDVGQRLAMAQHFASQHPQFGIDPRSITPDDVSDQGIAGHVAASMSLKAQLDEANRQSLAMANERAAFFQRAGQMGSNAADIARQWRAYAAMHFPQAGAPAPQKTAAAQPSADQYRVVGVE